MGRQKQKPTLMECAKRISSIVNINPSDINEIYFADRKGIHSDYYIRGVVIKAPSILVIVPDINNCEYILTYDTTNMSGEDIVIDMAVAQEFSQRDIAIILKYSQSSISRFINKEKGVIKNEEERDGGENQEMH